MQSVQSFEPSSASFASTPSVAMATAVGLGGHDVSQIAVNFASEFRLQLAKYMLIEAAQGSEAHRIETPSQTRGGGRDEPTPSAHMGVEAAKVAGAAFSVGAIWWALRAGGLMASLLSTAPVWRGLDPLPILRYKDEKDDQGEWMEEDLAPDARGGKRVDAPREQVTIESRGRKT
jgi:hypothetical protein